MNPKSLSLKEKIFQKFILGFSGTELNEKNSVVQKAIQSGLGGIILFSENIASYEQTARLTAELQKLATIPLIMSIDQEGGRVERTINIKNKIKYLTPYELAQTGDPDKACQQAIIMVQELKSMGINMNYAPVLDVNTCKENPIIGVRAFGDNPETVINFARPVYKTFLDNNIIPVIKHFPGHGDSCEDSHHTMPCIDLPFEELENKHIKPFQVAINDGVKAVMVAHAHYPAFEKEEIPASLSEKVIIQYLRGNLGFDGLVISDDMVMGGVNNYYDSLEACVKGIQAGIDLFIFRNSSENILNIIHKLVQYTENGLLSINTINDSARRILACKSGLISA